MAIKRSTYPRVVVTRPMIGICYMQVCAVKDASDAEILAAANADNPSGTRAGWSVVERTEKDMVPVQCQDDPKRLHFILSC